MTTALPADEIRLLVERYERLDEEEKGLKDDKKDVLLEAKARGFNVKVLRKIIAMRKRNQDDRTTEEAELALYAAALGMQLGFDI